MKLGERVTTVPTIDFNVESSQYRNVNFTVWAWGGQICGTTFITHRYVFVSHDQIESSVGNIIMHSARITSALKYDVCLATTSVFNYR